MNSQKTINIYILLKLLLADKKKLVGYATFGFVFGAIVAFSIPKEYKTSVMLAPESSDLSSLTSGMASLASMVGMDMKLGQGNDAIFPEIYPELMQSTDFLVSLFPIKVASADGTVRTTYYDYLATKQKSPFWTWPTEYLGAVIEKLKEDKRSSGKGKKVDPFMLSKKQYDIVQSINNSLDCNVDKKTSVISITVTAQDPLISALVADSVKDRLQVFITKYRTNKARNDLAYMQQLFVEAKEKYTKTRVEYATYSDSNKDLLLASFQSKQDELENEMQLQYNIYTQVAQQLQLAQAKVQERTPAFTVVQTASVPIRHSNKPKIMTALTFVLIAIMIRIGIVLLKYYKDIVKSVVCTSDTTSLN